MQVGYWQFVWNCSMIMTNEICMFFLLFRCFRMKEQVRFYKGWLNEMCIFLCRTAASWTERPDVRCLWISWLLLLAGNGLRWNWCAILRFERRWKFYGLEMSHVLMKWILYELKEFDKSINKLGNAHGLLISNYLRSLIRPAHERVDMYSADLCLDVSGKWVPWRLRDLIFLFSF